jgi:D-sedoheptulose 7-phosphate isomerase
MNQTAIKAICANDPNMITAYSNDFGYENYLERYCKIMLTSNDILIPVSSSGESLNIINAVKYANKIGSTVIGFSGFKSDNTLKSLSDINFYVKSDVYNVVETVHNSWMATLCDYLIKDEMDTIGVHGKNL